MTSVEFINKCFAREPEATYRVQYGAEVRLYKIQAVLDDAVIFKTGEQYRLHPIGLITIEPMVMEGNNAQRHPSLTLDVLGVKRDSG